MMLNNEIVSKYKGISFPKALRDRDNSVDKVMHRKVPLKRPTICDNFDDSYESTIEADEQTTEVTKNDNNSNIFIYDRNNSKEGIFDTQYDNQWENSPGKELLNNSF